MKKVDRDFLVITVPGVQVADGDQPLHRSARHPLPEMPNAVLTENAAGVVD